MAPGTFRGTFVLKFANILLTSVSPYTFRVNRHGRFKSRHRILLHVRKDVGIGIQSNDHAGMPQAFADYLRVNSLFHHQRGVSMTQIMESDAGKAEPPS